MITLTLSSMEVRKVMKDLFGLIGWRVLSESRSNAKPNGLQDSSET